MFWRAIFAGTAIGTHASIERPLPGRGHLLYGFY